MAGTEPTSVAAKYVGRELALVLGGLVRRCCLILLSLGPHGRTRRAGNALRDRLAGRVPNTPQPRSPAAAESPSTKAQTRESKESSRGVLAVTWPKPKGPPVS